MDQVLMVAYHYPPCRGSSGLQRTLSFSRCLPDHGWRPIVLTVHPRAYPDVGDDQLSDIPEQATVCRAFALDTARHLSVNGKYFGWMALPDRWVSWLCGAIPAGLRLIRRYKPRLIWSTYPIATAHLVGCVLHRLSGIPWVADFRDPMVEECFPTGRSLRWARLRIEKLCVGHAIRVVFCTPGARTICVERYPNIPRSKWAIVANGYDEQAFADAERSAPNRVITRSQILLVHSGLLYLSRDRDPTALFDALVRLFGERKVSRDRLRVVLRASGFEDHYGRMIKDKGLSDVVALEPSLPYRHALAEMIDADGLLIFQGYPSNPAIPAKLYEYLRARRPIFAMAHPDGDTARLLREMGIGTVVPLDDREQIARGLVAFLDQLSSGRAPVPTMQEVLRHSRKARAAELARIFDDVVGRPLGA